MCNSVTMPCCLPLSAVGRATTRAAQGRASASRTRLPSTAAPPPRRPLPAAQLTRSLPTGATYSSNASLCWGTTVRLRSRSLLWSRSTLCCTTSTTTLMGCRLPSSRQWRPLRGQPLPGRGQHSRVVDGEQAPPVQRKTKSFHCLLVHAQGRAAAPA